jgi:hypothetical protein
MAEYWGQFLWWLNQAQNAGATQAIVAIAQAAFTLLALAIAIYVPLRQQGLARTDDETRRRKEVGNLLIALREEVVMFSAECLSALLTYSDPEKHFTKSGGIAPLIVFESNASKIGTLERNQILPLFGFSASLSQLRFLLARFSDTEPIDNEDRLLLIKMTAKACKHAARFLKAVPVPPEEEVAYLEHVANLQSRAEAELLTPSVQSNF